MNRPCGICIRVCKCVCTTCACVCVLHPLYSSKIHALTHTHTHTLTHTHTHTHTCAQLAAVPADDWLVVSGHHPADEINVLDFTAALLKRGLSIYLNGHAHTLTQYTIDGAGAWVTSGAGSLVDTPDQQSASILRKLQGHSEAVQLNADGSNVAPLPTRSLKETMEGGYNNHTYQTVFNLKVAGR